MTLHRELTAMLANAFPAQTKLGQQLRLAAGHSKQADLGQIFHAVATPPSQLLTAVGQGVGAAAANARGMSQHLQHLDPITRSLAALPAALHGGAAAFQAAGGLPAAARTGIGALSIYGAKKLYDEATAPKVPGYYAPGGY